MKKNYKKAKRERQKKFKLSSYTLNAKRVFRMATTNSLGYEKIGIELTVATLQKFIENIGWGDPLIIKNGFTVVDGKTRYVLIEPTQDGQIVSVITKTTVPTKIIYFIAKAIHVHHASGSGPLSFLGLTMWGEA